jgi:hypothetical protein
MKVFLSHAQKDTALAKELAERLTKGGFKVWNPDLEIAPGDNWAKKTGEALDKSDLIVILLTPKAMDAEWLRREIEFALGSKKHEGRVFTVFVGPVREVGKDVPWILLKLPHYQADSARDFSGVVKQLKATDTSSDLSHSNA